MIRSRFCGSAVGFLCVVCIAAAANVAPTLDDQVVVVLDGSPTSFRITAWDDDIGASAPEAHPLRFVLIEGPMSGELSGDFDSVSYGTQHNAWVTLTYTPAADFSGSDSFVVLVLDTLGAMSRAATVTMRAASSSGVGVLSGSWVGTIAFSVQSSATIAHRQQIVSVYRRGDLTVKSIVGFRSDPAGGVPSLLFDVLRVDAELAFAGTDMRAALSFDPDAASFPDLFERLEGRLTAAVFGGALTYVGSLDADMMDSYQALLFDSLSGSVAFGGAIRFGGHDGDCSLGFRGANLHAAWSLCDAHVRAMADFGCSGFERMVLAASGISLPRFAWLPHGIRADATLSMTPASKSLAVDINWKPIRTGCIQLIVSLEKSGPTDLTFEGIALRGLILECQTLGGVRVRSATALAPAFNGELTGDSRYFESFGLSGELNSCCGIPGAWSVTTYFAQGSTQLFDWGMTLFRAEIGLSEHFSFRFDLAARSGEFGDPTSEFTVGWSVRW